MNLIIIFSARENGNCSHVAEFIKGQGDKVLYYKNLNTHNCSNCAYECMDKECKYRNDEVYNLYESFCQYDKVILIVPMYCGNPSSLYFSFHERCQDFFMHNENKYDEPDFIACFEKWFEGTPYRNHVLGIERHIYKQKMQDSVIEVESVRVALRRLLLSV